MIVGSNKTKSSVLKVHFPDIPGFSTKVTVNNGESQQPEQMQWNWNTLFPILCDMRTSFRSYLPSPLPEIQHYSAQQIITLEELFPNNHCYHNGFTLPRRFH